MAIALRARPRLPALKPEFARQIFQIGAECVDRHARGGLAFAATVLVGARYARCGARSSRRGRDRWNAPPPSCSRRAQIQRLTGRQIDPRFWFEIAGDLGAEDRVPRKLLRRASATISEMLPFDTGAIMLFVLSRARPGAEIRPGVEPVPGQVELAQRRLGQARNLKRGRTRSRLRRCRTSSF